MRILHKDCVTYAKRCESPVHMVENNVMLLCVLGHPGTRLTISKFKTLLNIDGYYTSLSGGQ